MMRAEACLRWSPAKTRGIAGPDRGRSWQGTTSMGWNMPRMLAGMFALAAIAATFTFRLCVGAEAAGYYPDADTSAPLSLKASNVMASPCGTARYYVDAKGIDSNPGSWGKPFATIQRAVDMALPGDRIYVRGGTYAEKVVIRRSGSARCPITISAFPNERVLVEDRRDPPDTWESFQNLVQVDGSYVILQSFEVKGSIGRGIYVAEGADHVTLRDLNVHHNWRQGIQSFGNQTTVDNCEIWQNSRSNQVRNRYEIWGGGVVMADGDRSRIRHCSIHNNHGEGAILLRSTSGTIEDSVLYDNWALNLYLDNATDALVQRNLVYCTNDPNWWRTDHPSIGIAIADETYAGWEATGRNQRIINNIVVGCGANIAYWPDHPASGLKNVLIANNTLVEARLNGIRLGPSAHHQNVRIENNIFSQSTGNQVSVEDGKNFSFSHNLYSRPVSPYASSPHDVIGDPRLARTIDWSNATAGVVSSEWFDLTLASPAIDSAKVIAGIAVDHYEHSRGPKPDIGAHEYAPRPVIPGWCWHATCGSGCVESSDAPDPQRSYGSYLRLCAPGLHRNRPGPSPRLPPGSH